MFSSLLQRSAFKIKRLHHVWQPMMVKSSISSYPLLYRKQDVFQMGTLALSSRTLVIPSVPSLKIVSAPANSVSFKSKVLQELKKQETSQVPPQMMEASLLLLLLIVWLCPPLGMAICVLLIILMIIDIITSIFK